MTLHPFSRTQMLLGREGLKKLREKKIAVFGIGGVGSYAVEGLARSGIMKLDLIDYDDICLTNINRQIHAFKSTVGRPKVEVMKERVLAINADAEVKACRMLYNKETSERLLNEKYDYVIDAIDMVSSKLHIIEKCTLLNIPVISSMGAGNKLEPTKFEVSDIYETSICPLAKVMRKELRKRGIEKLKVVYSKEIPMKPLEIEPSCKRDCICTNKDRTSTVRRQIPGSISFVPSVAGLIIAGEVIKDLISA